MAQKTSGGWRTGSLASIIDPSVQRDYVSTAIVQASTIVSGLLLFHLVAQRASVGGFAYYQVARGVVATLQPVAMIGLALGLQRYLPHAGAAARSLSRRAFAVQVAVVAVIGLLGGALAGDLAALLGIRGGLFPVLAIFVVLAGTCLWTAAISALRGTGQVTAANVAWVAGLGAAPLGAFVLVHSMEGFLAAQGAAMAAVAVCGVALVAHRDDPGPANGQSKPVPALRPLIRYGIRRTPGDIALPALFAFPTFFVAGVTGGAPEAGYVGFTTSAVTLVCAAFGMLTPVLLPRLSSRLAGPVVASSLWTGLRALPLVAAGLAVVATAVLAVAAPAVVRGFLGAEFSAAVPMVRLGLLASVPLAVFYAARPTLDALQDAPVTVKLLIGCFTLEVVVTFLVRPFLDPPFAAILGLGVAATVLGVLSYVALVAAARQAPGTAQG